MRRVRRNTARVSARGGNHDERYDSGSDYLRGTGTLGSGAGVRVCSVFGVVIQRYDRLGRPLACDSRGFLLRMA